MIRRLLLALLVVVGCAATASAQIGSNMIACWDLSSTAVASGSDTSLTLTNNGTSFSTGQIGNAAYVSRASTSNLTRASSASIDVGDIDFSWAGWVYFDAFPADGAMLAKRDATNGSFTLTTTTATSGGSKWEIYGAAGYGSITSVAGPVTFSTGTWYFLAVGHNATSNEIWYSVNAGTPATASVSTGVYGAGSTGLTFSGVGYLAGFEMDGRLDEWAFWKRDIRSDLSTIYNGGAGTSCATLGGGGGGGGSTARNLMLLGVGN